MGFRKASWLLALILATSCGSQEGGGLGALLQGLDNLPPLHSAFSGGATLTPSPPVLGTSYTDTTAVDVGLFGGALGVVLVGGNPATYDDSAAFWGLNNNAAAGLPVTLALQSAAEPIGRYLESVHIGCLLRGLPVATSGVTVSTGGVDQEAIFVQAATEKVVKVTGNFGAGEQEVFVSVRGAEALGAANYSVEISTCDSGVPSHREIWTVNRTTGLFTAESEGTGAGGDYRHSLSGLLIGKPDGLAFNPAFARTLTSHFSSSGAWYDSALSIVDDTFSIVRVAEGPGYRDTLSARLRFAGNSIVSLSIASGAVKVTATDAGAQSYAFDQAFEYSGSTYIRSGSAPSGLFTSAFMEGVSLSTTAPVVTLTHSCNPTPDVTVVFTAADPAIASVFQACIQERLSAYDFSNSTEILDARNRTWGVL